MITNYTKQNVKSGVLNTSQEVIELEQKKTGHNDFFKPLLVI